MSRTVCNEKLIIKISLWLQNHCFSWDFWNSSSAVQIIPADMFSSQQCRTTNHGEFSIIMVNIFLRNKVSLELKVYFFHNCLYIHSLKSCLTFISFSG